MVALLKVRGGLDLLLLLLMLLLLMVMLLLLMVLVLVLVLVRGGLVCRGLVCRGLVVLGRVVRRLCGSGLCAGGSLGLGGAGRSGVLALAVLGAGIANNDDVGATLAANLQHLFLDFMVCDGVFGVAIVADKSHVCSLRLMDKMGKEEPGQQGRGAPSAKLG